MLRPRGLTLDFRVQFRPGEDDIGGQIEPEQQNDDGAIAVFAMTGLWLGGTGMVGGDTLALFLIGLPALAVGTWAGLKLFGKLDEATFRRIVLVLLLISGAGLLVLGR